MTLSALTQPSKSQTFNDALYGTKILRLTGPEDGGLCRCAYSYWPAFNCNSTRLIITIDNTPTLYDFDAIAFKATKRGPLFNQEWMQFEGCTWSFDNPNILYGLSGYQSNAKVRAYDVTTKQFVWEKDFTRDGELPVGNPWQMSKARMNDDFFSFGWRSADGAAWKYAVAYDRKLNKTWKLDLQAAGGMPDFDECRLSADGKILFFGNGREYHFWQYETQKPEQRTVVAYNVTERGNGHFDIGNNVLVQPDVWHSNGNRIIGRRLDNPKQWIELFDSGANDWNQAHHVSLTGPDDSYALVSSNAAKPDYSLPAMCVIFLVKTDGSKAVKFLCQHRSSCSAYERSPFGNLSPDGRFFVYDSDWGGNHVDVYIGAIPDGIWSNFAAPPQPQPPTPSPAPKTPPTPPADRRKPTPPQRTRQEKLDNQRRRKREGQSNE